MCLPELFEYSDCLFSFRGFAVTGQACQYQMSQNRGRWQTRFFYEDRKRLEKRAPGHNQFRIPSKLVFDDCIR